MGTGGHAARELAASGVGWLPTAETQLVGVIEGAETQLRSREAPPPVDGTCAGRPGKPVIVSPHIRDSVEAVEQRNLVAIIVQAAFVVTEELRPGDIVALGDESPVPADHDIAGSWNLRPCGKLKIDASFELPASDGECCRAGIIELDKFQVPTVGRRRIIMNLVDDD